jgi:hypothetical protein
MANKLFVGFSKEVEPPKRGLFIHDEVPDIPRARIFDPAKHSFNPLKNIDYRKARSLADALYTIYPQGSDTLTVRNGKQGLVKSLQDFDRLDKLQMHLWEKASAHNADKKNNEPLSPKESEVLGLVSDILLSPVLKNVLCKPTNFSFSPNSLILARINRAELGDFDALLLGLFLIEQFKGQVVIPAFDFYGRDVHVSLIRENRLIVGLNKLDNLKRKAPDLRQNILSIKDREASGALYDDAVELAKEAGLRPDFSHDDNPYNHFIEDAMAP